MLSNGHLQFMISLGNCMDSRGRLDFFVDSKSSSSHFQGAIDVADWLSQESFF